MMPLRSALARVPVLGPAMFDLVRNLRRPDAERTVRQDLAETQRDVAWLRDGVMASPSDKGTLLVVSLTDMVHQLKLEAILAAALRLEGWRVRILTDSPANNRGRRYFAAFGLRDFVYLDQFAPTGPERVHCDSAARSLLSGDVTFQDAKAWSFDGAWIGPQILSTVSRQAHEGAPDPVDLETRQVITALLPPLLQRVVVAKRLVAHVKPDLGLVIEANDFVYGPFVDQLVAAGAPVIQVTQPWRDDALTLRRLNSETRRGHPSSVARETLNDLIRHPWTDHEEHALNQMFVDRYNGKWFLQARNQPNTSPMDRATIVRMLGLDAAKKTAVVFSHVLWDANLFYGEDLFQDYGEWFVETVRAAAANPDVNWIVKMHPANLWKRARDQVDGEYSECRLIRKRIGELPPHVVLLEPDSPINSLSLFEHADYGITVRGTSGMEMPCFGKPTLTAGTGRYSGLGFTVDSKSREEYLFRLGTLHEVPPMQEDQRMRARWHAYAAFILRPWKMKSFRSEFDYAAHGTAELDHNLLCVARSLAEAEENGDLRRFARWAAGAAVDYLEMPESPTA